MDHARGFFLNDFSMQSLLIVCALFSMFERKPVWMHIVPSSVVVEPNIVSR